MARASQRTLNVINGSSTPISLIPFGREGRIEDAYKWKNLYLYRELRSEAIRLMLPAVET